MGYRLSTPFWSTGPVHTVKMRRYQRRCRRRKTGAMLLRPRFHSLHGSLLFFAPLLCGISLCFRDFFASEASTGSRAASLPRSRPKSRSRSPRTPSRGASTQCIFQEHLVDVLRFGELRNHVRLSDLVKRFPILLYAILCYFKFRFVIPMICWPLTLAWIRLMRYTI